MYIVTDYGTLSEFSKTNINQLENPTILTDSFGNDSSIPAVLYEKSASNFL